MNTRKGISVKKVKMKKTTKKKQLMKKKQSFCRAKLYHIHGTLLTPPLPSPKGDSTSDLVVSLVTQTLIPHYGM